MPGAIRKPCPGFGAEEPEPRGQPVEGGDDGGQAAVRAADGGAEGADARPPFFPQSAGGGQSLTPLAFSKGRGVSFAVFWGLF